MRVVANEFIGALQDAAGGTVVLFQLDDFEHGVILLQLRNVFRACTAPRVDGLVVVTDRRECATNPSQQADQAVLAGVSVLVFIDQQITQFLLPILQGIGMLLKSLYRQND